LILTTEIGDLYAHLDFTDPILSDPLYNALVQTLEGHSFVPEELSVTVQTNPMVYLVWGGVALMLVGISIQFAGDLRPNGKR
jgi:cytochrome c biogenesis factor